MSFPLEHNKWLNPNLLSRYSNAEQRYALGFMLLEWIVIGPSGKVILSFDTQEDAEHFCYARNTPIYKNMERYDFFHWRRMSFVGKYSREEIIV